MIKTDNESSLGIEKVTYGRPRSNEPHESFCVSVKLPTYSSPKPTLRPRPHEDDCKRKR